MSHYLRITIVTRRPDDLALIPDDLADLIPEREGSHSRPLGSHGYIKAERRPTPDAMNARETQIADAIGTAHAAALDALADGRGTLHRVAQHAMSEDVDTFPSMTAARAAGYSIYIASVDDVGIIRMAPHIPAPAQERIRAASNVPAAQVPHQ